MLCRSCGHDAPLYAVGDPVWLVDAAGRQEAVVNHATTYGPGVWAYGVNLNGYIIPCWECDLEPRADLRLVAVNGEAV